MNERKCAIIGCGAVGSTSAFALVQTGLFSELVIIDINIDRAEGEAMDLSHGLPFLSPMKVYAGGYEDAADAAIVIIAAGAAQKPEESRIDLVHTNTAIFRNIVGQLKAVGAKGIILVVSNPVDVLTFVTLRESGFPPNRVIGSGTVLDTARLKQLLGERIGVDPRSVHAFIIGEHGDSELAVWSSANVSGIDLDDYCSISGSCDSLSLHGLFEEVRDSAYEVIQRKGATCYAIASAVVRIVSAIMRDERSIMPVSCLADGHYGVEGVCFGAPAVIGRNGIEKLLDIPLNSDETARLQNSVSALKKVIAELNY